MSIFGKKSEGEQFGAGRHGIGDIIRLLRSLPVDQHPELVVQVIRATLESMDVVHVTDLIQDAARHEQRLSERIAALRAQMAELSKQIDMHREEVSRLEGDLKETTVAKDRLMFAEQAAQAAGPAPSLRAPGPLPPPQPPARPKSGTPAPPLDPAHHNARG